MPCGGEQINAAADWKQPCSERVYAVAEQMPCGGERVAIVAERMSRRSEGENGVRKACGPTSR
jgi:hypothetical protein